MAGNDLELMTSDGVRIVYDDIGEGPPVLMVHGYDGCRAHWEYQRDAVLRAGHRLVAMDLRGHWASDTPLHGQRVARLGQDLRELIEALALEDVAVVAHSMGVSVTLAMFDISGFEPVTRFVAIEQSPKLVNEDGWNMGVRGLTWDNVHDMAYFRATLGEPQLEVPMPEGSAMGFTEAAFDHAAVSKLRLDHLVADWRDVLPRIPMPALVVGGRLSPYYDMDGMEWFASEMPHGQVKIFEKSGHAPHVSQAQAFNEVMLDFIAT
jgi:non-heme chloroperoxidase